MPLNDQTFGHQCNVFEPGLARFARLEGSSQDQLRPILRKVGSRHIALKFRAASSQKRKSPKKYEKIRDLELLVRLPMSKRLMMNSDKLLRNVADSFS